MSNYNKARPTRWFSRKYLTRKDWHHQHAEYGWSFYPKKKIRQHANGIVRRYKGDISDGGHYKKIFDVVYTVF